MTEHISFDIFGLVAASPSLAWRAVVIHRAGCVARPRHRAVDDDARGRHHATRLTGASETAGMSSGEPRDVIEARHPIRTAGRFLKNEPDAARSSRLQSRGRDGRFKKGHSGNPGGRPKILAEVKQAARVYTEAALKTPLRASLLPAPSSIMVGGEARLVRADGRA